MWHFYILSKTNSTQVPSTKHKPLYSRRSTLGFSSEIFSLSSPLRKTFAFCCGYSNHKLSVIIKMLEWTVVSHFFFQNVSISVGDNPLKKWKGWERDACIWLNYTRRLGVRARRLYMTKSQSRGRCAIMPGLCGDKDWTQYFMHTRQAFYRGHPQPQECTVLWHLKSVKWSYNQSLHSRIWDYTTNPGSF